MKILKTDSELTSDHSVSIKSGNLKKKQPRGTEGSRNTANFKSLHSSSQKDVALEESTDSMKERKGMVAKIEALAKDYKPIDMMR